MGASAAFGTPASLLAPAVRDARSQTSLSASSLEAASPPARARTGAGLPRRVRRRTQRCERVQKRRLSPPPPSLHAPVRLRSYLAAVWKRTNVHEGVPKQGSRRDAARRPCRRSSARAPTAAQPTTEAARGASARLPVRGRTPKERMRTRHRRTCKFERRTL
eukprot:3411140-Pleurochrysis_carterae.AAC.1